MQSWAQEGFHVGAREIPLASFMINQGDWPESAGNLTIILAYSVGVGILARCNFTDYGTVVASPYFANFGQ